MLLFAVHPKTKLHLINLLDGNVKASELLINKIKARNPNMNEQCCYSKAVTELKNAINSRFESLVL